MTEEIPIPKEEEPVDEALLVRGIKQYVSIPDEMAVLTDEIAELKARVLALESK